MSDIYVGRLVADGYGNLLADEGDRKGDPVAYHDGSYIFIQPGDASHNERHEEQRLDVAMTQDVDPDAPGYAGDAGNEHHAGTLEDDPHYDVNADNKTRLRHDPDKVAAKVSGHTSQGGN